MTEQAAAVSREDAIKAADDFRKAKRRLETIEGEISNKQAQVASKYEKEIGELKIIQKANEDILGAYMNENREQLLDKKQSLDFAGVKMGFRKATAKLALKGKTTWEKVLAKLKDNADWKDDFVKQKEEVDKTALKKADATVLKSLGVALEQKETFFVKL